MSSSRRDARSDWARWACSSCPLPVLQFAASRFKLQIEPQHLAKLFLGLRQFLLIGLVLATVLQSLKPFFRRCQLLERFRHLLLLLLLLDQILCQAADLSKCVSVFASWSTLRLGDQFAQPPFDDLRQLSAAPASEDSCRPRTPARR